MRWEKSRCHRHSHVLKMKIDGITIERKKFILFITSTNEIKADKRRNKICDSQQDGREQSTQPARDGSHAHNKIVVKFCVFLKSNLYAYTQQTLIRTTWMSTVQYGLHCVSFAVVDVVASGIAVDVYYFLFLTQIRAGKRTLLCE